MLTMFVTLDVSKLSGWLNTTACCRVEKRAYDAGRGANQEAGGRGANQEAGGRGVGGGGASDMHGEGPTQGMWGARARAERT